MTPPTLPISVSPHPPAKAVHWSTWIGIVILLAFSYFLNQRHNDFPVGYHADERKKGDFVLGARQPDFRHPILMIRLTRLAGALLPIADRQQAVELGRQMSAIMGTGVVLLTFLLARHFYAPAWALLAATATAVSPLLVVHAHYFKEDVLLAAMLLLAILSFERFVRRPDWLSVVLLGCATGLAGSTKYVGLLLIVAFPAFLIFTRQWRALRRSLWSLPFILITLTAVNFPIFSDVDRFWKGVQFESSHMVEGHGAVPIPITPRDSYFTFHFWHSLWPDLTPGLAILALIGVIAACIMWRTLPGIAKLVLAITVVYWLTLEFIPLKPFPNFDRYMVIIGSPLLMLAMLPAARLAAHCRSSRFFLVPVLLGVVGYAAWDALRLTKQFQSDTRAQAAQYVEAHHLNIYGEGYTASLKTGADDVGTLNLSKFRERGFDYVAVSSFVYDRYYYSRKLKRSDRRNLQAANRYDRLFTLPYVEFAPSMRSIAFSNPTIRIVDIRSVPLKPDTKQPATLPSTNQEAG